MSRASDLLAVAVISELDAMNDDLVLICEWMEATSGEDDDYIKGRLVRRHKRLKKALKQFEKNLQST